MFARIIAVTSLALLPGGAEAADPTPDPPPFSVGIEMPSQVPVTPAVEAAVAGMGIDYINYYINPNKWVGEETALQVNAGMLQFVARAGLDFSISCHTVDPPAAAIAAAREAAATHAGVDFEGVVIDEFPHIRLLHTDLYGELAGEQLIADPATLRTLPEAYAATLAGYRRVREGLEAAGAPAVTATHVWPVLHHVAARAGYTVCPKICKEFYSPVSLAVGLGAALQYDRPLWADCDLWFWDLVPGHSPEELRSNLLLAYWLGVDRVYLEGAGHNLTEPGRQGIPFSLMTAVNDHYWRLTAHGEMLRAFTREYVPAHPRAWTFRDMRPDVAIVRFPDTDYGPFHGRPQPPLYGSPHLAPTSHTQAWLHVWHHLTHGTANPRALSFFTPEAARSSAGYRAPLYGEVSSMYTRPGQAAFHPFACPLSGAVVFDHLVDYERLRGIPLLILTGVEVSEATLDALRRCVREGATLMAWGPLARRHGFDDYTGGVDVRAEGEGRVILTDDFLGEAAWAHVRDLIGRPDEIRYRFATDEGEAIVRLVLEGRDAVRVEIERTREGGG